MPSDLPPLAPLTLPCASNGGTPQHDYVTLSLSFTGDHVEFLTVVDGHLAPVPVSIADAAKAADWLTRAAMRRARP